MSRQILFLGSLLAAVFLVNQPVQAQIQPTVITADLSPISSPDASASAEATLSARLASPSAEVQEKIQEKKDNDITQNQPIQIGKLAKYLQDNPPGPLSWNNFIQHAILAAVEAGVQPNIIVLVLLFPLISSLIATSRHFIGLRGFGIYIPSVLAVALVSTGIVEGLVIFGAITVTALVTKRLLKKARLAYLPRTALLVWMISLGILALLLSAPYIKFVTLMTVNIFPILILVLLSENVLDALARTKPSEAVALTAETIGLAFISSLFLQLDILQRFALNEPELLIVLVAFMDILMGRFSGLRLTEFLRFRSIIEE